MRHGYGLIGVNISAYMPTHENTRLVTLAKSEARFHALMNIKKKFDLAGDELLRMEDESGISLSTLLTVKVDTYFTESQGIERFCKLLKRAC